MELSERWDIQPDRSIPGVTRNTVRVPYLLTPTGILPPAQIRVASKYDKKAEHKNPAEPPLTHVQQVANEAGAYTASHVLLSKQPFTRFNRVCCGSRVYGELNCEQFIRAPLPFQVTERFDLSNGDIDKELEEYDTESKRNKKQPDNLHNVLMDRALLDLKLPRKKQASAASTRLLGAEGRTSEKRLIMDLPKSLLTGPIGSFLASTDYLLLATTCRTMITRALWIEGSVTIWKQTDVPSHRHMNITNIRDYAFWRRTQSAVCQKLRPATSASSSRAVPFSHAIQSIDVTRFRPVARKDQRQIRKDVQHSGMFKELVCFACIDASQWGLSTTDLADVQHILPFGQLLCLEVTDPSISIRVLDLVTLRNLRSFRGPDQSFACVPPIITAMKHLRHLDIRPLITMQNDLAFPHSMGAHWLHNLREALEGLSDLETLRIDCDRYTGGPFFNAVSDLGLPSCAARLTRLTMTIADTTQVHVMRRIREQCTAKCMPKLRQLEIVFNSEIEAERYFECELMDIPGLECTQVTDLHIMIFEWDCTDALPIGRGQLVTAGDMLRRYFSNLKTLRLSGMRGVNQECRLVPSFAQANVSRTDCRWPADVHYYSVSQRKTHCKHHDIRMPAWTRHWLNEYDDPAGVNADVREQEKKHLAELRIHEDSASKAMVLQKVFDNHLFRGGARKSAKGQTIHNHNGSYWQLEHKESVTAQHALDFKVSLDILYCTQTTAAARDAVFKKHIAQLKYTVYAMDNCSCAFHDALRFLRMLCMINSSEFVRSLMQLVFEKSLLTETGKCTNGDLLRCKTAWISSAGQLSPAVNEAFCKQWAILTGGLKQTIEVVQIQLLNYTQIGLGEVDQHRVHPVSVLPDLQQSTRSFDVILRLIVLVGGLTKALIGSIGSTLANSMQPLCDKIISLEKDVKKSCDRLFMLASQPVDTLFDMNAATEALVENNPDEEVKLVGNTEVHTEQEIKREKYNMDFCVHKEMLFFPSFLVITGIIEHEDFLRSHITEASLERWFQSPVWRNCDMQQEVNIKDVHSMCSFNSPNRPTQDEPGFWTDEVPEPTDSQTESDEDAFPNVEGGHDDE